MPPQGRGRQGGPGFARTVEKPKDFKGALKRLFAYLGAYRLLFVAALACVVLSQAFGVIGPKVLGDATTVLFEGATALAQGTGTIDLAAIRRILMTLLLLYALSAAADLAQSWIMTTVSQKITYRLRRACAEKISRIELAYFSHKDKTQGDVLSRITNDVDSLGGALSQSIASAASSLVQLAGVLAMMLSISLPLTGVVALTLPLSGLVVALIVRFSQRYFSQQQEKLGSVNGVVEEDIAGQEVIQVFGRSDAALADFAEQNDALYESAWKSQFFSGLMMPLMGFVGNLGYVAVVVVGAALVGAGSLHLGDIQAFVQYVRRFTQPISQLASISNSLQQMASCAERVFSFLDAPEEAQTAREGCALPDAAGNVRFEHVRFGYSPDKPVIGDFSLDVPAGRRIAIVGPTGAGKTTLVKLLMRFWDVDGGSISVGGFDIRDLDRSDLRNNFSMVLQESWLFTGSIRDNIRFGKLDASEGEIQTAASMAYCDHFIRSLPGGYDFVIDEGAQNLSQGQRQLLTIARAIIADKPILILDEATSNVDTRTEELIQKAMMRLMYGRTSFVIAHRLSTIKDSDLILVMNDGDVVEMGSHDELLRAKGAYAELYNSQFEKSQTR